MFEYEGQQFTLEEVKAAADKRSLSVDNYVSQFNIKKVEETKQEQEAGKTQPQVSGAPVEETAAPDTVSKPEDTSLASRKIEAEPKKSLTISPGIGAVGTQFETKPAEITYGQATERIKQALSTTEEQQAEYFGQTYFNTDDADYIYSSVSAGTGAAPSVKGKEIKSYFGEEKYNQYQDYLQDPVGFFKNLPANVRSKYIQQQKESLATKFFRDLPESERIAFKAYTKKSEQIASDYSKTVDEINKQTELYDKRHKDNLDNLSFLEKEIQDWDDKNLAKLERVSHMVGANIFAGNQEKADEFEQIRNDMLNQRNSIFKLYKQAYEDLNKVKTDEFGNEYSYEQDRLDLLRKSDQLEEQFKNNKIIFDNFGDISAASTAAAYNYDLYQKGVDQLKTSLFVAGGKLGALGLEGLAYLAEIRKDKGNAEAFRKMADASSKFANEQFQKHVAEFVPSPKLKDVKSISDFGNLAGNVFADQASNIATVWAGGIIGNILKAGGSALGAIRTVQTATAGLMGTYSGSTQHAQMDIAQEQANIALYGAPGVEGLYDKREKTLDPVEKTLLDERIFDLEQSVNLTELQKLSTAILYGVTETVAERLGSIRVLDQWSNMGRSLAGTVGWRSQSNKVLKQLVKGTVIEEAEETVTAFAQNITSKYVAGDERVGFLDGIDADLFTSTALTTLVLQAPSVSTTVVDIITQQGLTEADRKEFNKLSTRAIELLNEKAQAKADGKRFKNNTELREIINKLGRDKAINFVKLQNLTEGELTKVFELQGEIESLRKKYVEIGAVGIEATEQEYADKTKVISDKINDLQKQKEVLLKNVFVKKYLGKDFEERTDDVRMEDDEIARFNYDLGKDNLEKRLTKGVVGDKRFFALHTVEEIDNLEISENKKKQLKDVFNNLKGKNRFGQYVKGLGLVYNQNAILEGIKNNEPLAKATNFHELTHWAFDNGKVNRKKLIAAADELVEKVKSNPNVDKVSLEKFIDRVEQYKKFAKKEGLTKETLAEELIMAYADYKRQGFLDNNTIERSLNLKNLFRDVLNSISPAMHMYSNLNTAEDIARFIDAFDEKVKNNRLRASAPEEYELEQKVKSDALSLGQKELNDRVDNLVGKKDENGNYQWKSKEEFQSSEEFINVYDKIINGNLIDPLIRRGIEGDVIYGKPIERFIEDVKDGLTGTLMRFDPTANNSLIGWINLQLGRRKGDVSNRYKKEYGEFGTTSIDIEAGEVGSLREIEAEDQAFDEAIDIEEEIIDETKGLIIPGVEILGEETNQELTDEITDMYTDLVLDGKNYKTLPRLATKYVAEKAGVPEAKIVDPKKNLSSGEYSAAANFLASIADIYIKILPEGAITQDAASEALKGTSTGVPKNVLNFAYNRNEERFKDPAGLFVFEKRKDLTRDEFLDAIGLNPDGSVKPGVTGRSKESQTVKGLLNLLDRIITNTAVRVVGGEMGMSMNTQLDIRSGTVDGVFSLGNVSAKKAEKQNATFIQRFEDSLTQKFSKEEAKQIVDNYNNYKPYDKASGAQTIYLNNVKIHNNHAVEFLKHFPPSVLSNNFSVLESISGNSDRMNAVSVTDVFEGDRYVTDDYFTRKYYKKFKKDQQSENFETNYALIADALISRPELRNIRGTKFANSKIISDRTKKLVALINKGQSLKPFSVSGINPSNFQSQMEKFDSAEWKDNMIKTFLVVQSVIIDFTDYYDPKNPKTNFTQEQFNSWIAFAQRLYSHTAQDNNGFRKLSIVDTDNSYAYNYQRVPSERRNVRGKIKSLLYGEHAPTNMSTMVDIMMDNLYNRQLSTEIPNLIVAPLVDTKAKDKKFKFQDDVQKVLEFFDAKRRAQKDQSRIIRYNKPGTLFAEKTKEENFTDILNQVEQKAFNQQMTYSLNTAVKVKMEDMLESEGYDFYGEEGQLWLEGVFKVGANSYRITLNTDVVDAYKANGVYDSLERKLKIPEGTISRLPIVSLAFGKQYETEDGATRLRYDITGDSAREKINQFTVFATVVQATMDAIKKYDIPAVTFTSGEQSRGELYHKFSRFFAKKMGWYTQSIHTDQFGGAIDDGVAHTIYNPEVFLKDSELTKEERQDWKINGIYSLGTLETKFASMISMKDPRITPSQTLDLSTARNLAAKRKKRFDVINPAANDFEGLMYVLLGKGKLGEEQYEWMQKNLFEPYGQATYRLNNTRQRVARNLKKIEKENKQLFKKLKKDSGFGGFTFEQALRVWMFSKIDKTPSGVDEDTQKALIAIVKNNPDIEQLGYDLSAILPMQEFWVDPDPETWQLDSIRTDVINAIEKVARKQFLGEWKANVDEIFSKNNMNKLTAAFGEEYIDALKDMLYRMETGSSRPEGMNKQMNVFMNWVRGSVATTMFFNRRSFVLQQISNVNYLNWGDNNPIAAAKAFANQKQYWTDFVYILNSDYLKERRGGLKTDINAAELAEAAKKHGYKGVLSKVLQAGFTLTQLGDSLAIATGGSTFYRNRVNTYIKQGLSTEEAERKAFVDFQEISEETQQSARPDRLSQQQTTIIGRTFLSFQNTPMQMTRLSVRAGKDLLAGRGDPKENTFKMLYYGAIQSIIFSMLQTALIGDMLNVFGDEEGDDEEELKAKKTKRVINGVVDSFLKGTGMYGVAVSTAKNAIIKFIEQEQRKEEGKRPDYAYVLLEVLNISPPVGIKARNFYGALKNYEYNAKYIGAAGWDLNNPAIDIGSAALDALLNIPALSTVTTMRDISAAFDEDLEVMTRLALIAGWHTWDLNLQDKELNKIKAEIKEKNKQIRKSKKTKRGRR